MDLLWICPDCKRSFTKLSMDYSIDAPRTWLAMSEPDRARRGDLTDDFCTIDQTKHFVRGCIELAVLDCPEIFVWGVWVAISEKSRRRIEKLWTRPIPRNEPPQHGVLDTWIGAYPEPVQIKCRVHVRPGDQRPLVVVAPSPYKLAIEQRDGITLDRVKDIASKLGHA